MSDGEHEEPGVEYQGVHRVLGYGCGCCWGEDPVGDVESGQDPVVRAVLEDVPHGHCGKAEAVHEEGLELAFGEVEGEEGTC